MTRVRLELMYWTGMRPSQIGRLRADDFRLDEPIPYVAAPRGKGGPLAAVPLVPEGAAAGRAFRAAESSRSRGSVHSLLATSRTSTLTGVAPARLLGTLTKVKQRMRFEACHDLFIAPRSMRQNFNHRTR